MDRRAFIGLLGCTVAAKLLPAPKKEEYTTFVLPEKLIQRFKPNVVYVSWSLDLMEAKLRVESGNYVTESKFGMEEYAAGESIESVVEKMRYEIQGE